MAQNNNSSNIKDGIRQKYEMSAQRYADQVDSELNQELSDYELLYDLDIQGFLIGGGILGIIIAIKIWSFWGLLIGEIISIALWLVINKVLIAKKNSKLSAKRQQLIDLAQSKVDKVYTDYYNRAEIEIQNYDANVNTYYKKVSSNSANIMPMIQHTIKMFQKMIAYSDARAAAHVRFVEAELVFTVYNSGIEYSYSGEYKVTLENFVFVYQRFRDLSYDYECEGLAQAIARLAVSEMNKMYPKNSMTISVSHNDAKVRLLYKGANSRFIPAKNIV